MSVVVKENEIIRPNISEIDYINDNCARDCYKKYFHTVKFKGIFENEMTNDDFVYRKNSEKLRKNFEKLVSYIN